MRLGTKCGNWVGLTALVAHLCAYGCGRIGFEQTVYDEHPDVTTPIQVIVAPTSTASPLRCLRCPSPGTTPSAPVAACADGILNQDELAVDCGGSTCAPCASCADGIQNQDELAVDCGGLSCNACSTCSDGLLNQDETDVDCGGSTCAPCASCSDGIQNQDELGVDCGGLSCNACSTCSDGLLNQDETDVDCGGSTCAPCASCSDGIQNQDELGVDCGGLSCNACPTCSDGLLNQDETDVDCGGSTCAPCASCSDGIQNQDELGVDCGGLSCNACPTCSDGLLNQDETDVDCGGSTCAPCASCTDGIQNQDELRVDCGGSTCLTCSACTGTFDAPELITGLGLGGRLYGPALSFDATTLYVAEVDADENIFVATREGRETNFSSAQALDINTSAAEGSPFVTADDLTLLFFSDRPGVGGRDIWSATRSNPEEAFGAPVITPIINDAATDHLSTLSADQLTLMFTSTRSGGAGGADLWTASRAAPGEDFSSPTNIAELNTGRREASPTLSADGLVIYFISNRRNGRNQVWTAARPNVSSRFGAPTQVTELSSSGSESDVSLSADEREIFFSSERNGTPAIWRAWRDCL